MPKKGARELQVRAIFEDLNILVFPAFIAAKRLALFESQIRSAGGTVLSLREAKRGQNPSYIIVDESLAKDKTKVRKLFVDSDIHVSCGVVTTEWLRASLKNSAVEPKDIYEVFGEESSVECVPTVDNSPPRSYTTSPKRGCLPVCQEETECGKVDLKRLAVEGCGGESSSSLEDGTPSKQAKVDVSVSSTSKNDLIIAELQKLADAFTSKGDTWRAHGYNKAISAIRRHEEPINSFEDAVKLPGIGTRMAEKVWEILECGSLRKVAEVCGDEKTKILELFTGVWGAGPSTAESWYQQGYRSLEDLKNSASLTKQQQVGLKLYDDFADKMSRDEVERIGAVVKEVTVAVAPSVEVTLVGSYRRGKSTCGDVDVLICCPDHIKPGHILPRILEMLKEKGFITDDLVHIEEQKNQRKYLGVCRLPGENQRHRRLDIFVAPMSERAAALMHYTGSALFNRTIRLDASKKGMCLSEHCLTKNVIRQGTSIINEGQIIPTPTEASIFEALGMKYLEPPERNY